jgi:sugar O-acyltransferase (sialic acid O-acetyltransferase NeuD family)
LNVLIFGSSGHAYTIYDIITQIDDLQFIGFVDKSCKTSDKMTIGEDKDIIDICNRYNCYSGVIGVGDNSIRESINAEVNNTAKDFHFVTIIHPSAIVSKSSIYIGDGTVVMPGAIINQGTKIGKHCIINSGAIIEHDCNIGDFVSVAPNATLGGKVSIGNSSAIGIGATILHNIIIGSNTIVGAGSIVTRDIINDVVAYGIPAKMIRKRIKGDKYL